MKSKAFLTAAGFAALALTACNDKKVTPGTYVDLNTGEIIKEVADSTTGYAVNKSTGQPVYLYVDNNKDTIFTTGQNVNNKLVSLGDGKYEVDGAKVKVEDGDVKVKYEDYKRKVEADGDYKIKDGDYKKKVEEDGDYKIKDGDYKKKVEEDGDVKIKNGDTKTKIEEDGTVKTKTNN